MEKRDLYELLGRTYSQLCDESDMAGFWQQQCEDMRKTVNILLDENEKLKAKVKEYEKMCMVRHD